MKKMLSLMLALSMVLALAACGSSGGGTPSTSGTTPSNSGSPSTSQPQQMPSSGGALRLALSTNDGSTKDDRVPTPWLNHNMATNLMWRGLLIADNSAYGHLRPEQSCVRTAVIMRGRINFGEHRRGNIEQPQKLRVPFKLMDVEQHSTACVGVIGRKNFSAGQLP